MGGLLDLNVARTGTDSDGGAAAVDDCVDVVAVEAALHGHGLGDGDIAGAGVGVEVEAGIADGETNIAAAGGELPVASGLAFGLDVAGAGAGFEGAGDAVEMDVAAAGFGFDIAGAGLLKLNVAGAGSEDRRALNAVDTDVAGAALSFDGGAYVLYFDVAGAGACANSGGAGEGDLVVDGDVAEEVAGVAFADRDVVPALNDGWVRDDLLDAAVDVTAAAHPAMAGVEVGDDVDRISGAGMKPDVAGAGRDGDVGGAARVQGALEAAVGGKGGGCGQGEHCGGGGEDFDRHGSSFGRLL
jgi:hypothetical protein